jgi:hypothetical protein
MEMVHEMLKTLLFFSLLPSLPSSLPQTLSEHVLCPRLVLGDENLDE